MRKAAVNRMFENNDRMKSVIEALTENIARWTDKGDEVVTAIPGLSLFRRDAPTPPASYMYERSICLIAQGIKRVLLGDDVYVYDPYHFFDHVCGSTGDLSGY